VGACEIKVDVLTIVQVIWLVQFQAYRIKHLLHLLNRSSQAFNTRSDLCRERIRLLARLNRELGLLPDRCQNGDFFGLGQRHELFVVFNNLICLFNLYRDLYDVLSDPTTVVTELLVLFELFFELLYGLGNV
jgi:hypothetical protein